ncbi:uncharacterized protein K441DRAFT_439989, partial [Cenococcum geophilum 1.58]|uniref:uncharacterized protein n=1 Tax=Cenococcum geophilum 1.58 TaxID=794803 RepID=UPI00358E307C
KYLNKNLSKGFIKASFSPIVVLVIFIKKPSGVIVILYINYRGLNKVIIKNYLILLLISKTLGCL